MGSGYPPDWGKRRKKVYKRDNYTCQECGRQGGPKGNYELHAHHIVPKSKGGSHKYKNLTTLCRQCHAEAHSWMGAITHRPQSGFWGWMHKIADSELNEFYNGCPSCGESELSVRWERLKFRKKAKVVQCSSCGVMYDERIKREGTTDHVDLVRVSSVDQIEAASSATSQERRRFSIREAMAQRSKAQQLFGVCPNCGEETRIRLKSGIISEKFNCRSCTATLKRGFRDTDWKMVSGANQLVGRTMSALEWEQIAVEQVGNPPQSRSEERKHHSKQQPSQTVEESHKSQTVDEPHKIPRDTWRGRVARVLGKNDWMDAHEVSDAVSSCSRINYTLSNSGASSVLSDMHRNDDVIRRNVSSGPTKYEYRLQKNAVIE